MSYFRIPLAKRSAIRRHYIEGKLNMHQIAVKAGVSWQTVRYYFKVFEQIKLFAPERLKDMNFYFPFNRKKAPISENYLHVKSVLPQLAAEDTHRRLVMCNLFRRYKELYPGRFGESSFNTVFNEWIKENNYHQFSFSKIKFMPAEDIVELTKWRRSTDHRLWQKAVVLQDSFAGRSLFDVAEKVEMTIEWVEEWVILYKAHGLKGMERKPWTLNEEKTTYIAEKKEKLNQLIHQSPKLHGVERTSWSLIDLAAVYSSVYNIPVTRSWVSLSLKEQGFNFRKAREVLTSPDPNFHEKLEKVKAVLAALGPNDKFFSIDEMGPCGIRLKGGWQHVKPDELKTVPAHQKAKGYLICTAALELSTNQVTHFYSPRKDSDEMIKLLEILLIEYKGTDKIYLSWDAASWHASKRLKARITELNEPVYRDRHTTPWVGLAPLPCSAQFLNVIESVFSGLAKSVLHNSDYPDVESCKKAIDVYFKQRNAYFKLHPKRAGDKIWGKEVVKPVFDDAQDCKDPRVRS